MLIDRAGAQGRRGQCGARRKLGGQVPDDRCEDHEQEQYSYHQEAALVPGQSEPDGHRTQHSVPSFFETRLFSSTYVHSAVSVAVS